MRPPVQHDGQAGGGVAGKATAKVKPKRHFHFKIPKGYRVTGFDKLQDYET